MKTFVILGAGGIGYHLAEPLVRFVNYTYADRASVVIIDGDRVEEKNLERQHGIESLNKNKATILAEQLKKKFLLKCGIRAVPKYFSQKTRNDDDFSCIGEDVTLFVCVDNDATRVFCEQHVQKLTNATMVVGGNDFSTGQAQLFVRRGNSNLTPKISQIAPEILMMRDEFPDEVGCDVAVVSEPQLIFVNNSIANAMLNLWWSQVFINNTDSYINEIQVNVNTASAHQFVRAAL